MELDDNQKPIDGNYEAEIKAYPTQKADTTSLKAKRIAMAKPLQDYKYYKGTDRLKAKFISYDGRIQLREFYFYDKNYVLERKIAGSDGSSISSKDLNGVTERHITTIVPRQKAPFGLRNKLLKAIWIGKRLRKRSYKSKSFHYSPEGYLREKEVYDALNTYAYSLENGITTFMEIQ